MREETGRKGIPRDRHIQAASYTSSTSRLASVEGVFKMLENIMITVFGGALPRLRCSLGLTRCLI